MGRNVKIPKTGKSKFQETLIRGKLFPYFFFNNCSSCLHAGVETYGFMATFIENFVEIFR